MVNSFSDLLAAGSSTCFGDLGLAGSNSMCVTRFTPDSVFAAAHRLKSACGSIGAYGLAERAEVVELHAREGSADIPAKALNELETAITEVTDFLQQELA